MQGMLQGALAKIAFLPKESAKDCRIRLSRFASSNQEISLLIPYSTTEITIKDTEVEADSPSHPLRPRLLYEAACAASSACAVTGPDQPPLITYLHFRLCNAEVIGMWRAKKRLYKYVNWIIDEYMVRQGDTSLQSTLPSCGGGRIRPRVYSGQLWENSQLGKGRR